MSDSNIISIPFNQEFNQKLLKLFDITNISNIMRNNIWIAGGFAREVAHSYFNLIDKNVNKAIYDYSYDNCDIDFFTTSNANLQKVLSDINSNKRFTDYYALNSNLSTFKNVFTENYLCEYDNIDKSLCYSFMLQFVNKFFYKDVNHCLNGFDLTNCKYGLTILENQVYLHYDEKALYFDKLKKLDISNCKSPLLSRRIMKYLKTKRLDELYSSEKNKNILKDYFIKIITKNWDSIFVNNMCDQTFDINNFHLKELDKLIDIEKENLIMFLGKIDNIHSSYDKSSYGLYMVTEISDWASDMIYEKNNME